MIYYLSPNDPGTQVSGGLRKLYDHVTILKEHGIPARALTQPEIQSVEIWHPEDIVVFPEVWGDGIRDGIPRGVRRVAFVQNGYLLWHHVENHDPAAHPYVTTPEMVGVLAIADHTVDQIREELPSLKVPVTRVRPSLFTPQDDALGFSYGPWPRRRAVAYFAHKSEDINDAIFGDLDLPAGWDTVRIKDMSYREVERTLRTCAILAAPIRREGFCGPTSEAMVSGAAIVAWPGGPAGQRTVGGPMEYLLGRAEMAIQDDIADLRHRLVATAQRIHREYAEIARQTQEWSAWFQAAYSREAEVEEITRIMKGLTSSAGRYRGLPVGWRRAPSRLGGKAPNLP